MGRPEQGVLDRAFCGIQNPGHRTQPHPVVVLQLKDHALAGRKLSQRPPNCAAQFTSGKITLRARRRILVRHSIQQRGKLRDGGVSIAVPCSCEGVTFAELAFCLREEFADSLADLRRRCRLAMGICQGTRCAGPAAALIAGERQLTFDAALSELNSLLDERWKGNRAVLTGDGLAQAELAQGAYYTTGALGRGGGTPWR